MRKILLVICCSLMFIVPGHLSLAKDGSKEEQKENQEVNKEIKEASKGVAKESKKIFRKTGKAGKSFWRGMKEGFKEAK